MWRCFMRVTKSVLFVLKASLLKNATTGFTPAKRKPSKGNDGFPNKKLKTEWKA